MFCSNCGQQNEAGARFCAKCGTALEVPAPAPAPAPAPQPVYEQPVVPPAPAAQPVYEQPIAPPPPAPAPAPLKVEIVNMGDSKFDGSAWGLLGVSLLISLGISFSLGIATPWLLCYYRRWMAEHTVINGRRLRFDGKGGDLFGKWLLWGFLCVVTCGIFYIWYPVKMENWYVQHTHFAD